MTCCDRCQCFADQLTSLDGFTLLCSECRQELLLQKEEFINNPPLLDISIEPVWKHIMQEYAPFCIHRKPETHVVLYGTKSLMDVRSFLIGWSQLSQDVIPEGIIDFGLPSDKCDIDGHPVQTSFCVYRLGKSMISLEEYECWVKIQMWP